MMMLVTEFTVLPVFINPTISAEVYDRTAKQAAGYILKLRKNAIARGMLERLQSNVAYEDMERMRFNQGALLFHNKC